jgi:hypothetical protein
MNGLARVLDEGQLLEQMAGFVRTAMSALAPNLDKTLVGTVDFLGEQVSVFTANGENVRTPRENGGLGIIAFTMGGNWYAGDPPGIYAPLCAENEVVLHNLLSPDDFLATLIHELVERYMMKTFRLTYDVAHSSFAEPIEQLARRAMKTPGWSWAA